MRMRKKPHLQPRMERCASVIIAEPEAHRGRWLQEFSGHSALDIEIGCGKGRFTAGTAAAERDVLLVAVERVAEAIVVAAERAMDEGLENVKFLTQDAGSLDAVFAPGETRRIYLNFCDPWPKNRDVKRRLTYDEFLRLYDDILEPQGEIHFKTDNVPLFEYSLRAFERTGYDLVYVTRDLHENGPTGIMTDYEARFYAEGVKINKAVAKKK